MPNASQSMFLCLAFSLDQFLLANDISQRIVLSVFSPVGHFIFFLPVIDQSQGHLMTHLSQCTGFLII